MPAPARPSRVAVVGTLNVDLVWQVASLPAPGHTVLATATERQFGGKGANQAVAAARQGARVTLVGAVGDDAEGRAYREHLVREGIDPAHVATVPGVATGTAHVYVDARGENLIVVDQGANARISVAGLDALLPQIDVLLVQLECALPAAVEALCLAEAAGVRTVLNASPVHAAFPWGRHAIDTVIVNEHECAECFGHAPDALRYLSSVARGELFSSRKVRHLVVTQGSAPTLHFTAEASHEIPTYPVQPCDTVGAGDTFAGTLAAQLAEGREWPEALRHANIAGALSTLALGAQAAMPTREQ
ncbi:MAG TPA: ribokinase, partial [Opitutaceae bacterium]